MNKKVDEEFIGIKDVYALQCIATELKGRINKAIEYIENDLQSFLYSIEYKTLLDILKGSDKEWIQ